MENLLFLIPIIVGPIFILAGILLLKYPPAKINIIYGYRTSNSMKNQDTWNFAQRYSAKVLIKAGLIYSLTAIIGLIYQPEKYISVLLGLLLMLITILMVYLRVEKAISNRIQATGNK